MKDFCRELNIDPKWPDLQNIYDEYKRAYDTDRAREMHILWRGETWYKDLYLPENVEKQFKNRISRAKLQAQQFFEELQSGQLKINLNADKNIELLPSDLRRIYDQSQQPAPSTTEVNAASTETSESAAPETAIESAGELDLEKPASEAADAPATSAETDAKPSAADSAENEAARQAAKENSSTLFIKAIPKWMTRDQVEAAASAVAPFKRLIVSNANPGREFIRMAWAEYNSHEEAKNALISLSSQKFTPPSTGTEVELNVSIHVSRGNDDVYARTEVVSALFSDPDRMLIDLAQARRLMDTLDKEKEIENNPLNDTEQNGASTPELLQQTLDRIVVYLRRVHLFDYYRGQEYLTEDSMILHSGSNVLRGVSGLAPARVANNVASICDELVNKRIETTVSLASFAPASQIERVVNEKHYQHCTVLEPEKVRCDKCQKLFKGVEFVKKHFINRHADIFMPLAEEEQFFQNYMADPSKLTASTLSLARFDRDGGKGKRGKDFGQKQHPGSKPFAGSRGRNDRFNNPVASQPTSGQQNSLSPPPGMNQLCISVSRPPR